MISLFLYDFGRKTINSMPPELLYQINYLAPAKEYYG